MMDFRLFLKQKWENNVSGEVSLDGADGYFLTGCRQMYEATGDIFYKEIILDYFEHRIEEDGSIGGYGDEKEKMIGSNLGCSLLFAYEQTSREKYQKTIEKIMNQLKTDLENLEHTDTEGQNKSKCSTGQSMYLMMPYYMEYETRFHNKAFYNLIVKKMTEYQKRCDTNQLERCWYLMALIDTIACTSMEIFEHYKSLVEIFKETIKKELELELQKDISCSIMLGYCILKACNIGVLNPEKYQETGQKLIDGVINKELHETDDKTIGIYMMANAQSEKLIRMNN